MRKTISLIAVAAAFAATPALAQISVGGQVNTGVGVRVDPGRTVGDATRTLDRTIERTDRRVNRALDRDVRVGAGADVRTGAVVRDNRGHRVGTVTRVHGNTAVVVQGNRSFHVPLASLYRSGSGLVTSLTRDQLRAEANANARTRGSVRY